MNVTDTDFETIQIDKHDFTVMVVLILLGIAAMIKVAVDALQAFLACCCCYERKVYIRSDRTHVVASNCCRKSAASSAFRVSGVPAGSELKIDDTTYAYASAGSGGVAIASGGDNVFFGSGGGGFAISAGGRVVINGQEITTLADEERTHRVELTINARNDSKPSLEITGADKVTVNGNAGSVSTSSAEVTVTNGVTGDVRTASGDVKVASGSVGGTVTTMSGDVGVGGDIRGNVSTMSGDISRRWRS